MEYTKKVLTSGYKIIEKELQTSLTSENNKNVLSSFSNLINSFCGALDDLNTEKKQLKILEKKGYYTPPVSVFVGNKFERVKRTFSGKLKKYYVKSYASFFPLRETLKNVFQLPGVYDAVFSFKKSWKNKLPLHRISYRVNFGETKQNIYNLQMFFLFFCITMIMRLEMLLEVTQEQTN